jgi:integrase
MRAINAADRLAPFGKTIDDAVDHFIGYLTARSSSIPLSALATRLRSEFKRRVAENEVSDRHAESLNETLKKLEVRFGNSLVSEITSEEAGAWLRGLPLAAKTRNKHRGYTAQIFNLAIEYGYTTANPISKIKKFRERSNEENGKIHILSAEETERLFRAANPEILPYLTLSFFCGIRRATLERLDWSDVKIDEKRVIVPRYKGKNQKRYRVTLAENALSWLRPYAKEKGSLLTISQASNTFGKPSKDRTHRLIKEAAARAGLTVPDNAGRHTFISMHVARYESIDTTALEADTSPSVIKSNYLDIVTKAEAEKFWRIPARGGEDVRAVPQWTSVVAV